MKLPPSTTEFLPTIGIPSPRRKGALDLRLPCHDLRALSRGRQIRCQRELAAEKVRKTPFYDTPVLLMAFRLREHLGDFVDCLVLSFAINHCDTLITEDDGVQSLAHMSSFQELLKAVNPAFSVRSMRQIL